MALAAILPPSIGNLVVRVQPRVWPGRSSRLKRPIGRPSGTKALTGTINAPGARQVVTTTPEEYDVAPWDKSQGAAPSSRRARRKTRPSPPEFQPLFSQSFTFSTTAALSTHPCPRG